jgi:nitronate monooxygenase
MGGNMPVTGKQSEFADGIERTMIRWPSDAILKLLGIDLPIIQAPMAGLSTSAMAIGVSQAGGLGSIAGALLSPNALSAELNAFRVRSRGPINLNFFCHPESRADPLRGATWQQRLKPYFHELGLSQEIATVVPSVIPFSDEHCDLVMELRPEIVSFQFGLPREGLVDRIKAAGSKILGSANTVEEAIWLEERGCDAIIAQGWEAGGHRAMFLGESVATQAGTMALVPQVVDAVSVPVIAAGGIADGRGIAAAFALGASGVQIGTAYLFCPEANVDPLYRQALNSAYDDRTIITNIFTGRPARAIVNRIVRELGPMAKEVPAFPLAIGALQPMSTKAKSDGSGDFTPFWSGQAASLGRELPANDLTRLLATEALETFKSPIIGPALLRARDHES